MRTLAGLCLAAAMLLTACVTAGTGSQGDADAAGSYGDIDRVHADRALAPAERPQGAPSAHRAMPE